MFVVGTRVLNGMLSMVRTPKTRTMAIIDCKQFAINTVISKFRKLAS